MVPGPYLGGVNLWEVEFHETRYVKKCVECVHVCVGGQRGTRPPQLSHLSKLSLLHTPAHSQQPLVPLENPTLKVYPPPPRNTLSRPWCS